MNSSQGGGSKDTWVLAHEPPDADAEPVLVPGPDGVVVEMAPRVDGVRRDPGPAEFAGQQQ